jgi:hypothetical protein
VIDYSSSSKGTELVPLSSAYPRPENPVTGLA